MKALPKSLPPFRSNADAVRDQVMSCNGRMVNGRLILVLDARPQAARTGCITISEIFSVTAGTANIPFTKEAA